MATRPCRAAQPPENNQCSRFRSACQLSHGCTNQKNYMGAVAERRLPTPPERSRAVATQPVTRPTRAQERHTLPLRKGNRQQQRTVRSPRQKHVRGRSPATSVFDEGCRCGHEDGMRFPPLRPPGNKVTTLTRNAQIRLDMCVLAIDFPSNIKGHVTRPLNHFDLGCFNTCVRENSNSRPGDGCENKPTRHGERFLCTCALKMTS